MNASRNLGLSAALCFLSIAAGWPASSLAAPLNISQAPLFTGKSAPPLTLLTLGRDHKLYYEAYNDASDLDADGVIDTKYKPAAAFKYYGYFNSDRCYTYAGGRFDPTSNTTDKKCAGAAEWSGDFLNYLTTSRMDALRKVLYGGLRSTDTATETVLERSFIPQDAHSWGKEYKDVATDGYDIQEYTPLNLPAAGSRHLLANTTIYGTADPLLRILINSKYRIWEWVSIERPVAGTKCIHGGSGPNCVSGTTTSDWEIIPSDAFKDFTGSFYEVKSSPRYDTHPNNNAEYNQFISTYATATRLQGTSSGGNIKCDSNCNPYGEDDYYLAIFKGKIVAPIAGTYEFAVDGDDAVELIIDGNVITGFYGGHAPCNCKTYAASVALSAGEHTIEFRHQERAGGDNFYLYWKRPVVQSAMNDYVVRVKACDAALGTANFDQENCRSYGSNYKPTGLLQKYGESKAMNFGLITGSYAKNLAGGVLRKPLDVLTDEIDLATGVFKSTNGIVKTIDKLKIDGFGSNYAYSCGWITTRAINSGECSMWGNPIAEMMYEGVRYFAGKNAATSNFSITSSTTPDATLNLPVATWDKPYSKFPSCSRPFQLVISDINPSYDTDQVPGVATEFGSFTGDLAGLNVSTIANNTITAGEPSVPGLRFIGQSGINYDGAPTPKNVTGLGNVRGLAPEEPTKQGGYYSGSVAYHSHVNDINTEAKGKQRIDTFAVALASPLPKFEIPVAGKKITLVPFAKSVGGSGISAARGSFQPTNQIVDFYVETISDTEGKFRVNFEDVEQGADHDMDAISLYTYKVNSNGTLTISLSSDYAAGGIIQHMGYIISGTTADGIYLEVRDSDTGASSDPDYFLDTPPNAAWNDGQPLPLQASRTFTPGAQDAATLLKDPLWFAAKWGGFIDSNNNGLPDLQSEWDSNNNGVPDSYFLVTNARTLEQQLGEAFQGIIDRIGSAGAVALSSGSLKLDTHLYQARFRTVDWTGQLISFPIKSDGTLDAQDWDAGDKLRAQSSSSRKIITYRPSSKRGVAFAWPTDTTQNTALTGAQRDALRLNPVTNTIDTEAMGQNRLNWLRGTDIGGLRDRTSPLGDMVNSSPVHVSAPAFFYPDKFADNGPENAKPYSAYRQANIKRDRVVYVGANDGMLHAFKAGTFDSTKQKYTAGTGEELFAYIPSRVFPYLTQLTAPGYSHRYYVDGTPTIADTFFPAASKWRTILVGGLRAGGQGVYALDVTDPTAPGTEDQIASSKVLWEFTDGYGYSALECGDAVADRRCDKDLGYTFGEPSIVRMYNKQWGAIISNGYNSDEVDTAQGGTVGSGNAVLFIVNAETGRLIKKIDTGAGPANDPTGTNRSNGLSTPAAIDVNDDRIIDYIYAGDLFGNLWKFDVRDTDPAKWAVVYKDSNNKPAPFFKARFSDSSSASEKPQSITSRPSVARHPYDPTGSLVFFGTGKYIEGTDNTRDNQITQSFYGLWDTHQSQNDFTAFNTNRNQLLKQEILEEGTQSFDSNGDGTPDKSFEFRLTSNNPITWVTSNGAIKHRGWYIDLIVKGASSNFGERQVSDALLRGGRVVFTTITPSVDECDFGGSSWIMALDARSGSRSPSSPFDFDGNGRFNNTDMIEGSTDALKEVAASGTRTVEGMSNTSGSLQISSQESKLMNAGTGSPDPGIIGYNLGNTGGRQSWIEIMR